MNLADACKAKWEGDPGNDFVLAGERRSGMHAFDAQWGQFANWLCGSENEHALASLVVGALVHLARHMQTGCPRSTALAIWFLARIAQNDAADEHLRGQAQALMEILERDVFLAR